MHVYPQYSDKPCMNAFRSIERAIAFDASDWTGNRRLAWIYAIVFTWHDDESWNELYEKFGWDESDRKRAEKLHIQWENAKQPKWIPKWIPVEDKLPDYYKPVLTYDATCFAVHENWRIKINPENEIHWSKGYRITHWMPMPEPSEGMMKFG